MVNLLREGKARAIGVSNFAIDDLEYVLQHSDVVPAVNQIEFHPFLYQKDLLSFCERNSIQLEAYSPLTRGNALSHPTIINIAKKNITTKHLPKSWYAGAYSTIWLLFPNLYMKSGF